MANRFFDTSAVVKHYHVEVGTPEVDTLLAQTNATNFVSELGVVEFHSVLARLVRTQQITAADLTLARGLFLADVSTGLWQVVALTAIDFGNAQQLLIHHGLSRSLRTLDALQLAIASALQATNPLDAFVCADANLCYFAQAEGLAVNNPEAPTAAGS